MDPNFRNDFKSKFIDVAPQFQLDNIMMQTFVRQIDYKTQITAIDMVYALSSLLESPKNLGKKEFNNTFEEAKANKESSNLLASRVSTMQLNAKDSADKSVDGIHDCKYANFWVAYDALDKYNKDYIDLGIELAKDMQKAIVSIGTQMIDKREVKITNGYRFAFLENDFLKDVSLFQYPLALTKLGLFIMETYKARKNKAKDKPLVIGVRNTKKGTSLITAIMGFTQEAAYQKNNFYQRFKEAKNKSGATVRHDGFDTSLIEIKNEDFQPFMEELQVSKKEETAAGVTGATEFIDTEKAIPKLLNQRYELRDELGKGAHGRIYSGKDKVTKQLVAVKIMDKISKNKSKYIREISLMKDMNKNLQVGFPKLLYYASDKNYYYIVMEQLNQSLKELKEQQPDNKFTLKTVTMIGLQLLLRLESIHKLNYIHRDLKPANIMTGRNKSDQHIIYLIDFGLTKKQNQVSNIPHNDQGNKVVGTAIYAGINAHLPGSNYFKKDDLESMMYVLCYLATGTLPWKNCKATDAGLDKMMKIKLKISPYDLFYSMPIEFAQIMEHIKTTPQEAQCDYRYIEALLKSVAYNSKFKIDNQFDWLLNKKNGEKKIGEAMRHQSSKNQFANFQMQESLKGFDSSGIHMMEASNAESSIKKRIQHPSNTDVIFKSDLNIGSSKTLNLMQNTHNIQEMVSQNHNHNEDQGGSALPVIQEKCHEEEKFDDTNQYLGNVNFLQSDAMMSEELQPSQQNKKSKHRNNNIKSNNEVKAGQPADKEGKIDINVTVNIQNNNQQQQELKDSSKVVQMTINHTDGVNVHVRISSSPEIKGSQMKQSIIINPFDSKQVEQQQQQQFIQASNEQQEDVQMNDTHQHQQQQIIDEIVPVDSVTFEEFENGIHSELLEMYDSEDGQFRKHSATPRSFSTHSNIKKMKSNKQFNKSAEEPEREISQQDQQ